ncbi:hypothetical protein [Nostoc sp. ChiQUE01b]|uniref:hypothetical protein n=1 Tax=Nostoc sp. ChiQUE01b TaxID=3075376 RepID=UPI002AD29509|nr:hypothetical protein [Nostoc sp. ChiQUE01b]MDZ8262305.1 hypothetical protein [Nostoc sp. ChiQUE01b]
MYETRQGRVIVESKVADAKKQANDALYETRQNNQKFNGEIVGLRTFVETKIQVLNSQVSKVSNGVFDTVQKSVNIVRSKIQSDIKTETESTRKYVDRVLVPRIEATVTKSTGVTAEMAKTITYVERVLVPRIEATVTQSTGTTAEMAKTITYVEQVVVPRIEAKVTTIEGTTAGLSQTYQQSYEAQAAKWNADLSKIQGKVGQIESVTSSSSYKSTTAELTKDLNLLKQEIPQIKNDVETKKTDILKINQNIPQIKNNVETNKTEILKIDKKVTEQAKVNEQALPKLDQILGILPLIPARAAAAIRLDIPTIPQIETAAVTGTCRTTQQDE